MSRLSESHFTQRILACGRRSTTRRARKRVQPTSSKLPPAVPQKVVVNDRMQQGYAYLRVAPMGEDFDGEFKPQLTPKEMLDLGVFGGKYMTDCRGEFPDDWFENAKLCATHHDPGLNFFGVNASKPLSYWRGKGWIHAEDPR